MSAPKKRRFTWGRAAVGTLAAVGVAMFGFSLMAGPANATDGNSGSVDTSVTTVDSFIERGQKTTGGDDDRCKPGNVCKKIDWCGKGDQPVKPGKPGDKLALAAADAPMVYTKGKGNHPEPECIKKPKIDYKCCVVVDKTIIQKVTVENRAEHAFKVKVQLGDSEPIVKWVEAGEKATFTFKDVKNGTHELVASVWAGSKTWCEFKRTRIVVKCVVPTPSTSTPSNPPSEEPSNPPTSSTPEPSQSTTPAPGGGGGDEPQLPLTGSKVGAMAGIGTALLALGAIAFVATRRRRGNDTQFQA